MRFLTVILLFSLCSSTSWAQAGSCSSRNGSGLNPICLQSPNVPTIGMSWQLQVDASGMPGASQVILQASALPTSGLFIAAGEVLFDPESAVIFVRSSAPMNGVAQFQVAIPNNPLLVGLPFTTQAGIQGGGSLLGLCNALDCVVGGLAPIAPAFSASVTSGSAPLQVAFQDDTPGTVDSWLWDFGDGGSSTLANPTYIYRQAGSYDVSLSVTGGGSNGVVLKPDLVDVAGNAPDNNVLLVVADDLSVSELSLFGLNPNLPSGLTPNIDALASSGLLFERAWSSPLCSASRALLMTGRYGFRTGIGGPIRGSSFSLRSDELTLPEAIEGYADAGYEHGSFGKWHLRSPGNPSSCEVTGIHGFDHFEGTSLEVPLYCTWDRQDCPLDTQSPTFVYQLDYLFDSAAGWIANRPGSWLCYLAPQSPFELPHIPPNNLQNQIAGPDCTPCGIESVRTCYLAAVQAFDTKLGQLISSLGPNWEQETTIIFTSDNGTPQNSADYHLPSHSKGSLYEGSLHVPLIIAGKALDPALQGTRSDALVSLADVYRTVANLAGAGTLPATAGDDSVDLAPLLQVPQGSTGRTTLFAEKFLLNQPAAPFLGHTAAMRNDQFKLIYSCELARSTELYDLVADPLELNNLLAGAPPLPGTPEGDALLALEAELLALMDC